MDREDLQMAISVKDVVMVGGAMQTRRTVREEVKELGQALVFEVLAIAATDPPASSSSDED
jgi:hypothetical protein